MGASINKIHIVDEHVLAVKAIKRCVVDIKRTIGSLSSDSIAEVAVLLERACLKGKKVIDPSDIFPVASSENSDGEYILSKCPE